MTALICACLAGGLALVWSWVEARRFSLERRLAPRLRVTTAETLPRTLAGRLLAPLGRDLTALTARWGAPTAELEARLTRAGSRSTAARHRIHVLASGAVGLAVGLALGLVWGSARGVEPFASVGLAAAGAALGVAAPDVVLARRVRTRTARIRAELPAVAELLALAVVAGESVPAALGRVSDIAPGPLGDELRTALAEIRAGGTLGSALERLAARTAEPGVTSLCAAVATALERGTPLADVLHAQAADVRDRGRQALLEEGGKREIAMLVPVVLLILPVTVLFALYPGLVALRLGF